MRLKVVVHEAEEGGFWAEVPAIPGCATQGETFEELLENLYEAVEGCLSVDTDSIQTREGDRILEIAVWSLYPGGSLPRLWRSTGGYCCEYRGHHIYGREDSVVRLSVPVHGNQPLKTGLLAHLMKMAGLSEGDL
jgi:predicted RNase H-like HicB family nuclease/predicted RNA binding protein YcfA (HicA-like mRNA interferase family)